MTTPRDAIGLSERLRAFGSGDVHVSHMLIEAATALDELQARVMELIGLLSVSEDLRRQVKDVAEQWQARATRAEQERDTLSGVIDDTVNELGCANDNEAILEAIAKLRQERDEALERLKPFASGADALWPSLPDEFEVIVRIDATPLFSLKAGEVRAARDLVRRLAAGTEKEGE